MLAMLGVTIAVEYLELPYAGVAAGWVAFRGVHSRPLGLGCVCVHACEIVVEGCRTFCHSLGFGCGRERLAPHLQPTSCC